MLWIIFDSISVQKTAVSQSYSHPLPPTLADFGADLHIRKNETKISRPLHSRIAYSLAFMELARWAFFSH